MSELIVLGIGVLGGIALLAILLQLRGRNRSAGEATEGATGYRPSEAQPGFSGHQERFDGP